MIDRLSPCKKQVPVCHISNLTNENFFQLRIFESVDFINVKDQSFTKFDTINLTSDVPYKKFEQDTTAQTEQTKEQKFVVEETYLYLDNINKNQSLDKSSNPKFGIAYYFITYPMITESATLKYFNDPYKLFTNSIKEVQVGYWVKNEKDEIVLLFKNSNKQIVIMKGRHIDDYLGISKVSHPATKMTEESFYDIWKFVAKYNDIDNLILPCNLNVTIPTDIFFERIDRKTGFIDLAATLDLGSNNELHFYKIPPYKRFVYQRKNVLELVTQLSIGNEFLFFNLNRDDEKYYQFDTRNVHTLSVRINKYTAPPRIKKRKIRQY